MVTMSPVDLRLESLYKWCHVRALSAPPYSSPSSAGSAGTPRIGRRRLLRPQRLNRQLMGIRSKVAMLPSAMRAELDRLIVDRAFSGYQALAEVLQAKGYRIS